MNFKKKILYSVPNLFLYHNFYRAIFYFQFFVFQYHVGQLWSVAQASKNETGGGEGVEVQKNEPFDLANVPEDKKYLVPQSDLFANGQKYTKGQYTFKVYYLTQ